jgi:hypothetical protein
VTTAISYFWQLAYIFGPNHGILGPEEWLRW